MRGAAEDGDPPGFVGGLGGGGWEEGGRKVGGRWEEGGRKVGGRWEEGGRKVGGRWEEGGGGTDTIREGGRGVRGGRLSLIWPRGCGLLANGGINTNIVASLVDGWEGRIDSKTTLHMANNLAAWILYAGVFCRAWR